MAKTRCRECDGTGKIDIACENCDGTGKAEYLDGLDKDEIEE